MSKVYNIMMQKTTTELEVVDVLLMSCGSKEIAEEQKLLLEQQELRSNKDYHDEWAFIDNETLLGYFPSIDGNPPRMINIMSPQESPKVPRDISLAETKIIIEKYGSPYHILSETVIDYKCTPKEFIYYNSSVLHKIHGEENIYDKYNVVHDVLIEIEKGESLDINFQDGKCIIKRPANLITSTKIFFLPVIECYLVQLVDYTNEETNQLHQFLFSINDNVYKKENCTEFLTNASLALQVK